MLPNQASAVGVKSLPIILGAGLTGMAISRCLSKAGIAHSLVGSGASDTPRLGESLNAEGSLEIVRQFPKQSHFFFNKDRTALLFGEHAISFESLQSSSTPAYYSLMGFPSTVQLLQVDRLRFDRAVFDAVTGDEHCQYLDDRPAALNYRASRDYIDGVYLASRKQLSASYVFDATTNVSFVGQKLGIKRNLIGEAWRVVFAHYNQGVKTPYSAPPWMNATSLLRLDSQHDPVDGLAWCIPLGEYVSVGISVDPAKTKASASLLLDWTEKAYATRGIDVRAAFSSRGGPVDFAYRHYAHERCYGGNWLLAGPSCCQVWFPSASGIGIGLIAARFAADILQGNYVVAARYQRYLDRVVDSHAMLDWLVRDDPASVSLDELQRRSQAMVDGNIRRLVAYLELQNAPPELARGDALARLYESDRRYANPVLINSAPLQTQGTRLFTTRI
jgi:flavin-dependent dehydrogenase